MKLNLSFILILFIVYCGACTSGGGKDKHNKENKNGSIVNSQPTENKVSEATEKDGMIFVEGGAFIMGSDKPPSECVWCENETPAHKVKVHSFWIGKTEVTQKQWKEVMGGKNPSQNICDNCPVEQVSWNEVQDFIKALNAKTGKHFRLPTEAEWEFAARGGNSSKNYAYSGCNTEADLTHFAHFGKPQTHPVGELAGNELGIQDMSGNVWEWCCDYYDKDFYKHCPSENPENTAISDSRVMRGGGWNGLANDCRCSVRFGDNPADKHGHVGFRLAHSE